MQHKRNYSRGGILFVMLIGLAAGVVAVLLMRDLPPPQHAIERELDAQTFSQQ